MQKVKTKKVSEQLSERNAENAEEIEIDLNDLKKKDVEMKEIDDEDEVQMNEVKQKVKRIIGGAGFQEGKWPWLVSLQGKIPEVTVRLIYFICLHC